MVRADRTTVFDLFDRQRRYLVPVFQRGYVWGRADQWEPLWRDLLDQVTALTRGEASRFESGRKHFLGALVLHQPDTATLRVACTEVIDGQQRLMTLQVLLAALRDTAGGLVSPYLAGTLARLTANPGPLPEPEEQFKVWPTGACRDDFRRVMAAGSPEALEEQFPAPSGRGKSSPTRPPLVEAYLYFAGEIRSHLRASPREGSPPSRDPARTRRAERLIEALTRRVQLVAIELDAEDDPQVIFETLNARGVPLGPSDLIRNYLFLYAARHEEQAERLYERWWRQFEEGEAGSEGFWRQTEQQGPWKRSRLDLFLFHYITLRTRRVFRIAHLFREFRKWWEAPEQGRRLGEELEALHRSALAFRSLLLAGEGSLLGRLEERPRATNLAPAYPLLLWLAEQQHRAPDQEFEGMVEDVVACLLPRAGAGRPARNYQRAFAGLLDRMARGGAPTREALRRELDRLK